MDRLTPGPAAPADPIRLRSRIGVTLVQHVGSDAAVIAAARVSLEGAASVRHMDAGATAGLVRYLMRQKHGTPFEHASLTFLVEAPIFVFREWHRHRVGWSYNETSARYKEMDPVFWVPDLLRKIRPAAGSKPARPEFVAGEAHAHEFIQYYCAESYRRAWAAYRGMLNAGYAKEVARCVLPVATFSSMYATCNPRSLMAFLALRTHDPAARHVSYPQAEIEDAARQMEAEFARLFPITHAAFVEFGRVSP